ncbi:Hypothetical protein PHPALM_14230 [Phytophthora palmivora]|uniref:ATP-binding cassette (ABC) Superfamily n=1 Tax=Phytophthora palmivora TaxID=4796 RepID=A0A2P4XVA3_9STRA|nr:Hypothetical protein PHPALM_14230 [Phytophthora palmivora]
MRELSLLCFWRNSPPSGLNRGRTSRGVYERALVQNKPLFDETLSLRKKPEDRGGLFPVWWNPWVQLREHHDPNLRQKFWISLKNFTLQELKELRDSENIVCCLGPAQSSLCVWYLIAKQQLHSVIEGLRQQSKASAHDESVYDYVNPETLHLKAAKKPRTTYAPAVISDHRSP